LLLADVITACRKLVALGDLVSGWIGNLLWLQQASQHHEG
jgi:hypothetical protein